MNRDPEYLLDILLSARIAIDYLKDQSLEDLENSVLLQDAVIRRLLIIGEAANRISTATKERLSTIPWRPIKGMRNRLVHEYDDLDLATVWETVKMSLPDLVIELEKIVTSDLNS